MAESAPTPAPDTTRDCYCRTDGTRAAHLDEDGVPEGFCGICERCGAPGHTRHYPGAVPYTGSWCDRCYSILRYRPYVITVVLAIALFFVIRRLWP